MENKITRIQTITEKGKEEFSIEVENMIKEIRENNDEIIDLKFSTNIKKEKTEYTCFIIIGEKKENEIYSTIGKIDYITQKQEIEINELKEKINKLKK